MQIEHKSFNAVGVDTPEDAPGQVSAVVAVFNNVDHGKDRIRPGFFEKSLARKLPKGVWGHDWASPIAKTLEARELHPGDPLLPEAIKHLGGLYIRGQFNLDTQRGREAYSDVKFGIIDEFSIGYRTKKSELDRKSGVRDLIEGDIHEWSPVLAGMNDQTRLLSVKDGRAIESPTDAPGDRPESGPSFEGYSREVESMIGGYADCAERLDGTRVKEGRALSTPNRSEIQSVRDAAASVVERLDAILERTRPPEKSDATTQIGPEAETPPAPAEIQAKAATVPPDVAQACYTRLMDARRLALIGAVAGDIA